MHSADSIVPLLVTPSGVPPSTGRRRAIDAAFAHAAPYINRVVPMVPGGYDMPLVVAVARAGLSAIVAKSELGAAFIAAGFAWETGRPTVIVAITSPGVYGTMQALYVASVNRIPIVLLSGETSIPGSVQAGDGVDGPAVTRVTAPLCAWAADVTRPVAVPGAIARAIRVASFQRRPVHLNIATHVASTEIDS